MLKTGRSFPNCNTESPLYLSLFEPDLTDVPRRYIELFQRFYNLETITPCIILNHIFYNWGHQFLYTSDELTALLKIAGFSYFESHRPGESSIKEAQEPGTAWSILRRKR